MRYNKFFIKNFKGIRELTIDLNRSPRSNIFAIVGLNESGKTTILEAMHWLHNPDDYDPISLIPKNKLANFNEEISVAAEIGLSKDDENNIAEFLYKEHKFSISEPIRQIYIIRNYYYKDSSLINQEYNYNIKITGKTKKMRVPKVLEIANEIYKNAEKYIIDNIIPPIIYYENFLFNFPDKLYLATKQNYQMSPEDLFYKRVIQDVMNSMDMNLDPDKHLTARYKSGLDSDRRSMGSTLDKLGSKITTEVFIAWRELLKFTGTGLSITLGQTLEEDKKGYYIKVQVKKACLEKLKSHDAIIMELIEEKATTNNELKNINRRLERIERLIEESK